MKSIKFLQPRCSWDNKISNSSKLSRNYSFGNLHNLKLPDEMIKSIFNVADEFRSESSSYKSMGNTTKNNKKINNI